MTARFEEHDGTCYQDYGTIDDVLANLEHPDYSDCRDNTARNGWGGESWDMGVGYQGALDAYMGGWAEGAQKAEELAERVIPRPIGRRTTLVKDVTGMFPDVGAYLAGAPNSMYTVTKRAAKGRPYVHLYLPIGYLGGCDADTAFNRGCAMVAVVDALETAGCRVRVTLMRKTSLGSTDLCCRFEVKDYGDRLDIDQMIFTAAHPAFYRRIIFRLQELSEHRKVRTSGKGGTIDPKPHDLEPDGMAILVLFPTLLPRDNGTSPEEFLERMVAALPEELQSDIEPVR